MPHITLLVHNIRSAHNVGAIFRTAEGFGVEHIVLSGYTPRPIHAGDTRLPHESTKVDAQIHKTALGAEKMVSFEYVTAIEAWFKLNALAAEPMPIYALEQAPTSQNIATFEPAKRFALLIGEEVNGVNQHHLSRCSEILEIPMRGQKESFNVSVATGIALYALTT